MPAGIRHIATLCAAALCVFSGSVLVCLRLMPARCDADYLVAGSLSTLLALGTVFITMNLAALRSSGFFFRVRRRPPKDTTPHGL